MYNLVVFRPRVKIRFVTLTFDLDSFTYVLFYERSESTSILFLTVFRHTYSTAGYQLEIFNYANEGIKR